MDNKEAVLAFSLAFDYLRNKGENKEEYILGLSKLYVGFLNAFGISLVINIILCAVVALFFKDSFNISIGALTMFSVLFTAAISLLVDNTMKVDRQYYDAQLKEYWAKEKSSRTKLIWKYNLPLLILLLTHLTPIFILGFILK